MEKDSKFKYGVVSYFKHRYDSYTLYGVGLMSG
jgi:hypothetical protein